MTLMPREGCFPGGATPIFAEVNNLLAGLADDYAQALKEQWGPALMAVAMFGSVARREAGPDSDVDLLIVSTPLPPGRLARQRLLEPLDARFDSRLAALRQRGIVTDFSPILKTPDEAQIAVPLYLDMTEDAIILYEQDAFLSAIFERVRQSLRRLGARRRLRGRTRYWELKPDYLPNEVFTI